MAESFATRFRRFRFQVLVVIVSVLVAEAGHRSGILTPAEHLYSDLWHRASGARFPTDHVALVVVDDQSLAEHGDVPMVFWTPLFARAAATLRQVGASVVGIDFLFGFTPEDWIKKVNASGSDALRDYDLAFRQELNQGRIVLSATGYIANAEQSPLALSGIVLLNSVIPAVFSLLGLAIAFYSLTSATMNGINADLAARRGQPAT